MTRLRVSLLLPVLAMAGAMALPAPAQAWWRGGVGFFAPPIFFPPPVYYPPPPVYYAPPPAYAAPAPARWSTSCEAGPYLCPLDVATPAGSPCSCPANRGRAWGRAR